MMNTPWRAEVALDQDQVLQLIAADFPQLGEIRSLKLCGASWDNHVYEVNGVWILRIPKREIAVARLEQEIRVLPRLQSHLGIAIPEPTYHVPGDSRYPWPRAVFRRIPGQPLCEVQISDYPRFAKELGTVLRKLHGFEAQHGSLQLVSDDRHMDYERRLEQSNENLCQMILLDWKGDTRKVMEVLETQAQIGFGDNLTPVIRPVHADVDSRHLFVRQDGTVQALIDWGDFHYGDCSVDLEAMYSLVPPSARAYFLIGYEEHIELDLMARANFRALHHATAMWCFAHSTNQPLIKKAAERAIAWSLD